MRHLAFIAVALCTFTMGVLFDKILEANVAQPPEMLSVAELQEDEWHRLFEAAEMLGDDQLKYDVHNRMMCGGPERSMMSVPIQLGFNTYCVQPDGRLKLQDFANDDLYYRIPKNHTSWVARHMDFLESVSTKQKAELYVLTHFPRTGLPDVRRPLQFEP